MFTVSTTAKVQLHLEGLKVSSQVVEDIKAQGNPSLKHLFAEFMIPIFKDLGELHTLNSECLHRNVHTYKE